MSVEIDRVKQSLLIFCLMSLLLTAIATAGKAQHAQKQNNTQGEAAPKTAPITTEELREAQELADRFIMRLRETRDLRPLKHEFFISDLKKSGLKDRLWSMSVNLPVPRGAELTDDELWRFYAARFSLDYLLRLYLAGKMPLEDLQKEEVQKSEEKILPQTLVEYSKTIKLPEAQPTPTEGARLLLSINEHYIGLLQDHLAKHPPEETEQFKKNLATFADHTKAAGNVWGKPTSIASQGEIVGYPSDTRFIRMEIPFHVGLILVREKGQLKIWFAVSIIPTD